MLTKPSQRVVARRRLAQVEADEREPGRSDVDVAVDERGCHETAVEIDHLRIRELPVADVVGTQPRHDAVWAVADGHRSRIRHGRTVNLAAD